MRAVAAIAGLLIASSAQAVPIEPRDTGNEKWATVRGQIVFGGDKAPAAIPTHAKLQGAPDVIEPWLIHPKSKGVKNVFVWLAIDTKDRGIRLATDKIHPDLRKIPEEVIEIDVHGKQFFPNSVALRAGQTLRFKNTSDETHNFRYQSRETAGNVIVAPGKSYTVSEVMTAESYPLMISSNLYTWMKSHARVFGHPYFAVTDDDGKFDIRQAPVGTMRMWLWHPESGFRDGAKGRDGDVIEVKPRGTDVGTIKIRPLE